MADSVKATKDAIWYIQQDINKEEKDLNEWTEAVRLHVYHPLPPLPY
jgi:hypothetical protein